MTRKEKIEFLVQYQAGLKTIKEFKEREMVITYENGFYHPTGTNLLFNKDEIEEYVQGVKVVMYLPANGREL